MRTPGPPRLTPCGSPLAPEIHRCLQCQRAAGYRYGEEARALQGLDRCLADPLAPDEPVLTPDLVRASLARRGTESETTRGHRLSLLRQLCRFLALTEPRTAIPAPRCLGIQRRLFVPRGLTRAEGRRFLRACVAYPGRPGFPLRGVVHGTALIRLYLTGRRVGEAVHLTGGDVDLARGGLHIRGAKFGKARRVPLAADLTARLARGHAAVEPALGPRGPDAPVFPGPTGQPCAIDVVRYAFRKLLAAAGIPRRRGDRGPRLHDLRHRCASLRLLLGCEQAADLGAQLPLLATSLGHVGLTSSQRYLQLTADLLGEVTRRHQARFGSLITDGRTP